MQNKTSTKIHKWNPYQIKSQMQQLTRTPAENASKTIPVYQKNIYDMNIQHQELKKWMQIENTLKGNLSSQ